MSFLRIILLGLMVAGIKLLGIQWGTHKPGALQVDKLKAIRKVAIVSVYGQATIYSGLAKASPFTPFYDATEQQLQQECAAMGWTVIPLDATRELLDNEYLDTCAPLAGLKNGVWLVMAKKFGYIKEAQKTYVVQDQRGNGTYLREEAGTSTHTTRVPDIAAYAANQRNNGAVYSESMRKALGILTGKLGADAFIIVKEGAYRDSGGGLGGAHEVCNIWMTLCTTDGNEVFRDNFRGEGSGFGISTSLPA